MRDEEPGHVRQCGVLTSHHLRWLIKRQAARPARVFLMFLQFTVSSLGVVCLGLLQNPDGHISTGDRLFIVLFSKDRTDPTHDRPPVGKDTKSVDAVGAAEPVSAE